MINLILSEHVTRREKNDVMKMVSLCTIKKCLKTKVNTKKNVNSALEKSNFQKLFGQ